jgi:hypothetical protein
MQQHSDAQKIKSYADLLARVYESRVEIESALSQGKSWTLFHDDITNARGLRALVLPRATMLASFRDRLAVDVRAYLSVDCVVSAQEIETEGKRIVHHALLIYLRPPHAPTCDWG